MMNFPSTARPQFPRLLLRLVGSRFTQPQHSFLHRHLHLATEVPPSPQLLLKYPPVSFSLVNQIADILKTLDHEAWRADDHLNQLLFSSSDSASPPLSSSHFLEITRRLGNSSTAFKFFQYLQSSSSSSMAGSLPSVFQAIFEFAGREPDSLNNLLKFFNTSKEKNIRLNLNSAMILIRSFSLAKLVDRVMAVYNELDPCVRTTYIRNSVIGSLLRHGCLDDAMQVLDEMLQPDSEFRPNDSTGEIVFAALSKGEKYANSVLDDQVVELVSKLGGFGVFPDSIRLAQIINRLCRRKRNDRAWDLLHALMKMNTPVDAPSCNVLLTSLGRGGQVEKMNLLMKEMKENGILPNVVTFGIAINHLCKSRRIDQALEVLEKMKGGEDGVSVEPDVVIYNTVIDGLCKVGRQDEGLALMEKMSSGNVCVPNTVTYNCLIDGFCKVGELDRAMELFDAMSDKGAEPNVITVNTLVDGMCRHGRISSALEFYNRMRDKGIEGDASTYTTLIRAFCSVNNINKAFALFHEMRNKCRPDAIVYYTLIMGLSDVGRMDDADSIVSQMKEHGFQPDITCYNVLIRGFCKKNKLDKAYELLKEMEMAKLKPDVITYNTLISHFSKKGDLDTALGKMKRMLKDGLRPTVSTYGAIIHAFCLAGNLNEAMRIFREMSSTTTIRPNTIIYNTLMDALCKNKKLEAALSLLDDMTDKEVKPNSNTFNAIFKALQETNLLDKAFELMDRMTEQSCNPDYITMEVLTEWLSVVGETDRLKKFIQGYKVSTAAT